MDPSEMKLVKQVHKHTSGSHSHCQPSRTDSAWKINLPYELEAFTLHAEPSVFPGWCLFLLASRRPILLRNRSNFLGVKCVCTQKRLFLINKRLLPQILSTNENTCTWFEILAVKKMLAAMLSVRVGSACNGTSLARPGSARSGHVQLSSARPAV